ncbi:Hsp20/alpha crystallin family protein [Streptosporangiaceae bacterium NEAU-GS5]|nr:Hsp20/alpha crystallin family protein [Streptosporangiaceae bacterium NEAU-GS5]
MSPTGGTSCVPNCREWTPTRSSRSSWRAACCTSGPRRPSRTRSPRRSEFAYGALYRSVTLPTGAKTEEITATYKNGVLEVVVPLAEPKKVEGKRIAVTH